MLELLTIYSIKMQHLPQKMTLIEEKNFFFNLKKKAFGKENSQRQRRVDPGKERNAGLGWIVVFVGFFRFDKRPADGSRRQQPHFFRST